MPLRLRRICIISDIQNAAFAGLEAFTVSRRQLYQLDGAVARICRIAMKGKASQKDEKGKIISSMSNAEILK